MSLAFTALASAEAVPTLGVLATSSVTVATNTLTLVCIGGRVASSFGVNVFSLSGLGQTWVRGVEKRDGSGANDREGALFYSMGTGATGAITITGPIDLLDLVYGVVNVTGVVTTGANGAGAVNNTAPLDANAGSSTSGATQPSLTITGTPAAIDMTFAMCMMEDAESGETEKAGWTNLVKIIGTGEVSLDVMYNTSHDQSPSWSGLRTDGRSWVTAGALIKALAATDNQEWFSHRAAQRGPRSVQVSY